MSRIRPVLAAGICALLASVAAAEPEPPTQSEVETSALERFKSVLDLVVENRQDEAREAAAAQAQSMQQLSPYEQSCIHLTLAWLNQLEGRHDAARESFEKGRALAENPVGVASVRGLLLGLYAEEERLQGLWRLRRIPPWTWTPQEPDHWPDGFPDPPPEDI